MNTGDTAPATMNEYDQKTIFFTFACMYLAFVFLVGVMYGKQTAASVMQKSTKFAFILVRVRVVRDTLHSLYDEVRGLFW